MKGVESRAVCLSALIFFHLLVAAAARVFWCHSLLGGWGEALVSEPFVTKQVI